MHPKTSCWRHLGKTLLYRTVWVTWLTWSDWFSLPSSCMAAVVSSSFLLSSTTLAWSFSISPSPFTHLKHKQGTLTTAVDMFTHQLVGKRISYHRFLAVLQVCELKHPTEMFTGILMCPLGQSTTLCAAHIACKVVQSHEWSQKQTNSWSNANKQPQY